MFFAPVHRTRGTLPYRSFDRSFERFVNDTFFSERRPGFDVKEDDKAWTVTLDVPGIAREDVAITIEERIVRIETRAEAPRQYKAAYELPEIIDADATTAKLENGVLTLALAKKQPEVKSRKVDVK